MSASLYNYYTMDHDNTNYYRHVYMQQGQIAVWWKQVESGARTTQLVALELRFSAMMFLHVSYIEQITNAHMRQKTWAKVALFWQRRTGSTVYLYNLL